jgi:hypothetical protein
VRETENLVRKALKGEGGAIRKPPELSVVSEVLRTKSVRVELHQKSSGAGMLIVEFKDSAALDSMVKAIKGRWSKGQTVAGRPRRRSRQEGLARASAPL